MGHLVADGTDVVLTTQYLEEADRLAGRLLVLDRGGVTADGSPAELKAAAGLDVVTVGVAHAADLDVVSKLAGRDHDATVDTGTLTVSWPAADGPAAVARLVPELADREIRLTEIGTRRPTLDEVFLQLTGERL